LQIFHGGRMCPPELLPDHQPIAPSAVAAEREEAAEPREMTAEEITDMVKAFGEATRRAIKAGYDGVEIHGITMDDTLHLVDRLADQQLDYLHISVGAFWNGSIRDANDQTSRVVMVHECW
jgi:2,4-dienoyl-CoA reductase-like NADH-dependent reductase (Old Yellow Enzyme family)